MQTLRGARAEAQAPIAPLAGTSTAQPAPIAQLEATLEQLQGRIAPVAAPQTPAPAWAQVKRPEHAPKERRKRAPAHNAGRPRSAPTRGEEHADERCPDCGQAWRGHTIDRRREGSELPLAPAEGVAQRVITRSGPVCQRWQTPPLDLPGQGRGPSRCGVRLLRLVASLRTRRPVGPMQELLHPLGAVHIAEGALGEMLRRLSNATEAERVRFAEQARASPAVQGDETGWRENGPHGDSGIQATPEGTRLSTDTRSRAGTVAPALCDDGTGGRCTDFDAAYHGVRGRTQRCGAHLLRDRPALKEAPPTDEEVRVWAGAVRALDARGQQGLPLDLSAAQRERAQRQVEERAPDRGRWQAPQEGHPGQTLAPRLRRHRGALCAFVRVPEVAATNNRAERGLRPLVIARQISGGTRSPQGTRLRLHRASLFESWPAHGLNAFLACLTLLLSLPPQL